MDTGSTGRQPRRPRRTQATRRLRLPAHFVLDWLRRTADRGDDRIESALVRTYGPDDKPREASVDLNDAALADLIADVLHFTDPRQHDEYWRTCRGLVLSARATHRRLHNLGLVAHRPTR
ncbi:MAG: hypothetical protein L0H93_23530 [Nocardioides sp.]|nr:hypothetical protein [Nocardioides sp.]